LKYVKPKTVAQAGATIGVAGVAAAGSLLAGFAMLDSYHHNKNTNDQLASEAKTNTEQTD